MPPAGAVDGRWPSETTSLSTSTRAAQTRRTRPSTSPTRSPPRCPFDGSSALVPGAEHGDCGGGDRGCVVVAEAIVATQGHHNGPGGVLTGIEGRADGVAHRQAVRAGAVVDVVVIEDLDVGVLGGVGAGGCRGNRRRPMPAAAIARRIMLFLAGLASDYAQNSVSVASQNSRELRGVAESPALCHCSPRVHGAEADQCAMSPQSTTKRCEGSAGSATHASWSPIARLGTCARGTRWTAWPSMGARLGNCRSTSKM